MIRSTETLLRATAAELLEDVRRCRDIGGLSDPTINWHGLADVAASRALDEQHDEPVVWGEAAALLYELLARSPGARESFQHSEMMLRAALIRRFGRGGSAEILDPSPIYAWFEQQCVSSPEDAYIRSQTWRLLPRDEVYELRRTKNAIAVLKVFRDRLSGDELTRFGPWLELWEALP